jgi:hypothetical protein
MNKNVIKSVLIICISLPFAVSAQDPADVLPPTDVRVTDFLNHKNSPIAVEVENKQNEPIEVKVTNPVAAASDVTVKNDDDNPVPVKVTNTAGVASDVTVINPNSQPVPVQVMNLGSMPFNDSGMIMAWDPIIRDSTGKPTGETRQPPSDWSLCDGLNGTPNLTNRFLMGVNSQADAGQYGGSNKSTSAGTHYHDGKTNDGNAATGSHNVHCSGNCGGTAGLHKHDFKAKSNGGHNHGDNRPAYYTVIYICNHSPENRSFDLPID